MPIMYMQVVSTLFPYQTLLMTLLARVLYKHAVIIQNLSFNDIHRQTDVIIARNRSYNIIYTV